MSKKSAKSKAQPIENAAEVIERFGGIRPMAKKIEVAATTVQGWKKRDKIPAARREMIIKAAANHNVKLDDLLEVSKTTKSSEKPKDNTQDQKVSSGVSKDKAALSEPANESKKPENKSEDQSSSEKSEIEKSGYHIPSWAQTRPVIGAALGASASTASIGGGYDVSEKNTLSRLKEIEDIIYNDIKPKLKSMELRAVLKSSLLTFILIGIVLGAAFVLFVPYQGILNPQTPVAAADDEKVVALERRIAELENELESVEDEQSFLSGIVPKNLDEQIQALKNQASQAQEGVNQALEKTQAISSDLFSNSAGSLEERLIRLEAHISDLTGSPVMADLLSRYENLSQSFQGQTQLSQSVFELNDLFANMGEEAQTEDVNAAIDEARDGDQALGQTLAGVPKEDLKAAALLLTMNQMRSSLNRNNEPFEEDLSVLMNLVGDENSELKASLERLAPHADGGVLTPQGLNDELRSLSGDLVVASLKGEDVSVTERAQARFSTLFQVKKDGELVGGTPAQTKIAEAETMLNQGNIEGAIQQMQSLDGEAGLLVQPWLEKAQISLLAKELGGFFEQSVRLKAYGKKALTTGSGSFVGNSELIKNDEAGITILRRKNKSLDISDF